MARRDRRSVLPTRAGVAGIGAGIPNFTQGIARGVAAAFKSAPNLGPAGTPPGFIGPMTQAQHQASRTRAGRRSARSAKAQASARFARRAAAYRGARKAGAPRGVARGFAAVSTGRMAAATAGLGEVGSALQSVLAFGRMLKGVAESRLDDNRRLAPYSGKLALGLAQLDLGDQMRNIRLARSAENSAVNLAGRVNGLRETDLGFQKLGLGIGNRIGSGAASLLGPAYKELGDLAGVAADRINKMDPNGNFLANKVDAVHRNLGYYAGWVGGYVGSWGDTKAAEALAKATQDDIKRQQKTGVVFTGWEEFMKTAANLPVAPPARIVKP